MTTETGKLEQMVEELKEAQGAYTALIISISATRSEVEAARSLTVSRFEDLLDEQRYLVEKAYGRPRPA